MTDALNLPLTQSANDFEGLARLRSQAGQDGKQAIKETAQQFESFFIGMMLKSMRETVDKSELSESAAQDTFSGMFDKEVAHQMSRRGSLGIASMLERDFEKMQSLQSTADALKQREGQSPALHPLVPGPAPALPLQPPSAPLRSFSSAPSLKPLLNTQALEAYGGQP